MNKEIYTEFLEGIHEVYSTVFTDGIEDGIKLYRLSDDNFTTLYKERKVKRYKEPILLVAKAVSGVQVNDVEVADETIDKPTFTVPYKSMLDNGLICQTEEDWDYLDKSFIEFHNAFYEVKKTRPSTFIQDTFMMIVFECEYRKDIKDLLLEEKEEEE